MFPALLQLNIGILTAAAEREALLPYDPRQPLVLLHDAASQPLATDLLEGLALQLLLKQTRWPARLTLVEHVPSRHLAQLKRLLAEGPAFGEQLFTPKAATDRLAELNELAHRRYALLATANVSDLFAYNATVPRPEPFHYLLLTGLEAWIGDTHHLHHLRNLTQQGPAVGIVPLLLIADAPATTYEPWQQAMQTFQTALQSAACGFDLRGGDTIPFASNAAVWRLLSRFQPRLGLAPTLRRDWAEQLLDRTRQVEERSPHTDFLSIPIGHSGARTLHFALGEASNAYHCLIGGSTRSGKSTLLNRLILIACETFTPDELRLWLFDYREGVEFTLFSGLPHLDALHIDSEDKAYAIEAFARFEGLMRERAALFRQCDPPVARLVDYNRVASATLPRCLMIVDEAQSLFDDREMRPHAKRFLKEVARKGAAFGLHVVLSTQSYQNVDLDPDVKAQFRLRIGLRLSTSMECRALMGQDNDAPLNLARFTAVYNNDFGEAARNRIVALDDLAREDLIDRLARIKQSYPERPPLVRPLPATEAALPSATPSETYDWADWDKLT